jgi:hypothetical protein
MTERRQHVLKLSDKNRFRIGSIVCTLIASALMSGIFFGLYEFMALGFLFILAVLFVIAAAMLCALGWGAKVTGIVSIALGITLYWIASAYSYQLYFFQPLVFWWSILFMATGGIVVAIAGLVAWGAKSN